MDDQTQNNQNSTIEDQNQTVQVQDSSQSTFQTQVSDFSVSQVSTPASPVSVPQKEQAPIPQAEEVIPEPEYIKPVEAEPQIPEEVRQAGVKTVSEKPIIKSDIQIEHAKESIPVQTQPQGIVQLSQKVDLEDKNKDSEDSVHWLKILLDKVKQQLGIK